MRSAWVQRRHFFRQRHFGRIHAARKEREFPGIAVDMRMAIGKRPRRLASKLTAGDAV